MDIRDKAKEVRSFFRHIEKNDKTVYVCVDGTPAYVYDLIRAAHGDLMPNDYTYQFIVESLDAIYDMKDDSISSIRDLDLEANIYTSDLLQWLASNISRIEYCDYAANELGYGEMNTLDRISAGQYLEKREVLLSIIDSIENLI